MNALLSYLPGKLSTRPDHEMFGNQLYANYLPRVLIELGYVVDYIDWQDTTFKPAKHYDLFIGHGGYNFKQMAHADKNIYFSTGFYWREFNRLEAERFDNLERRRGVRLQPDRHIETDEESALQMADGIITLGNKVTRASYADFMNVYAIGGMTAQAGQDLSQKDYDKGRKHFLFYSGDGAVHKGLDLLIEAFAGTDLHLHICQDLPIPFVNVYPELEDGNIHYHRKIDIHSEMFKRLVNLCDWVISATCCEGCPSSVMECMTHGLIPVATRNVGIDMQAGFYMFGIVEDIRENINLVSTWDTKETQIFSEENQSKAKNYYSPAAFSLRLKKAIEAIV